MHDAEVLIQHYLEGRLTDAEAEALHAMLLADPALGERVIRQFEMDAMLHHTAEVLPQLKTPVVMLPKRRFTFHTMTGVAAMAAAVALMAAWGVAFVKSASPNEATTASVAVLARGVNLVWEEGSATPGAGAPLSPGWLRIKSGLAQIEFYQGARVSLQGPASLRLISSGEAYFESGKLSASVPPQAKGFRINTAKGGIVDLGTEFGMEVSGTGAEVHVFKGEVELYPADSAMQSLREGQAMAMGAGAALREARVEAFSELTGIDAQTAAQQRAHFERWRRSGERLNDAADVLLRFDFQDAEEARMLRNRSLHPSAFPDGSIVACHWTQGRWPGKRALEFRNVSDRVRVSVPVDLPSFTLAAWVRVDGLDRAFNSLFMSEGWRDRRVHWQITREGRVRLGVAGKEGKGHVDYDSSKLFTPERFGQWMHLAVAFDATAKVVRHYADGELTGSLALQDASPVKIGLAELGNWNDRAGGDRVAIRHLSGAMDEFVVWKRALSDGEIVEAMGR